MPRRAEREVFTLWALGFGAIVIAWAINPSAAKLVATAGFLYLPLLSMDRRGEDYRDFGVTTRALGKDLKLFGLVGLLVFPLFVVGYAYFGKVLTVLPPELSKLLAPYVTAPHFQFRLPDRFLEWAIDAVFVVALPEEFFYRGFVQTRLRDAWPQGKLFLGVRLGPAFWLTAVLFALGHLAIFQVWRLGVFFPALIFGWMREKSGTIVGAALFHAASNLLMLVLESSFYGR